MNPFLRFLLTLVGGLSLSLASAQYSLNGNAIAVGNDCYRLTSAQITQAGSVWYNSLIDLDESFTLYFTLNLGNRDGNGADGMAFVLQNQNTSIGSVGGGLGFQGISPSFAVEFDTYQNASDPAYDHIAIQRNGDLNHNGPNNLAGPVQALVGNPNIEDGNDHDLKISWDEVTQTLEVYFDCTLRVSYTGNIAQQIFGGNSQVFWGFTAATGALFNEHRFCLEYISFAQALEDTTICQGESVTLDPGTGTNYLWSPATGLSNPAVRNPVASPSVTTTYSVTVTDICGQSRTDQVTLTVDQPVSVDLGPDTTLCQGDSIFLSPQQSNGTNFLWSTTDTNPGIMALQPGTYTVDVWNEGCEQPVQDDIVISWAAPPVVNLPADDTLCVGDSLLLDGTTAGATSYLWSTGQSSPSRFVSQAGTYSLSAENAYCPAETDAFILTLTDSLTLDLGPDQTICETSSVTLTADHPDATGVLWSTGATLPSITADQAGVYFATLTGAYCPAVSDTMALATVPVPEVELGPDQTICEGDSLLLDGTTAGATSYLWSSGQSSPSLFISQAGTYTLSVTNAFCPAETADFVLTLADSLTLDLGPDQTICETSSVTLTADHPDATGVLWSTGATLPSITADQAGVYFATLTGAYCPAVSDTMALATVPVPEVELGPDQTICEGDSLLLQAQVQHADRYLWSTGSDQPTLLVTGAGSYELTVSNEFCAPVSALIAIASEWPVEGGLLPDTVIFCPLEAAILDGELAHATYYRWNTGATQALIEADSSGLYVLEAGNQSCGAVTDSVYVIRSNPEAAFTYYTDPDYGEINQQEPVIFAQTSPGMSSYRWYFSDDFGVDTGEMVVHTFEQAGSFVVTLEVTDPYGRCQDTSMQVIEVYRPGIYLPNAFTPNGDAYNPTWQVQGTGLREVETLIFDRWGKLIFQVQGLAEGWDGNLNGGAPAPEGVYVFKVTGKLQSGQPFERSGTVTLIR